MEYIYSRKIDGRAFSLVLHEWHFNIAGLGPPSVVVYEALTLNWKGAVTWGF